VLRWITASPCKFGFTTERWTAPRVAAVLEQQLDIRMNHRYLNAWLRLRGITPQIPPRLARERDDRQIAGWIAHAWPGIKKKSSIATQPLFSRTRAGSCCSRSSAAPSHPALASHR
jgi:hypothetical protein